MDNALKQRLVGASVLIALAVIVLPMLLGGRPDAGEQQVEPIELPARPDGVPFETRRFPLADAGTTPQKQANPAAEEHQPAPEVDSVQLPETVASTDQAELSQEASHLPEDAISAAGEQDTQNSSPTESDQAVEGLPSLATVEIAESGKVNLPVAVPEVPASLQNQAAGGRYAVQVASLGSAANAKRLQSDLEAKGFEVILDSIESDVGKLNRVRVGPFDSEAEATAAVKKIQTQVDGVSPRLIDLDPASSTQDTKPSDPLVRWVVQLGSFGESSNADNLVKQVRAQGLSAYSEKMTSSSGAVVSRVLVGPFLQREDATKAQQSLSSSLSINGVVMSAD
jgi:DedD protein